MSAIAVIGQKYINWVLFLLLEGIALYLVVSYNSGQREILMHSSTLFSGSVQQKTAQVKEISQIKEENAKLTRQNAELMQALYNAKRQVSNIPPTDSCAPYTMYPAKIISQRLDALRNTIIVELTQKEAHNLPMGVITPDGVIGIMTHQSGSFGRVNSLLNVDTRISGTVKNRAYFGTVSWDGNDRNTLLMEGVPRRANIHKGDTIVTNGYSTMFPRGMAIGTIIDYEPSKTQQYYDIYLQPINDFAKLQYVYIIKNNFAPEIGKIKNEQ